MQPASGSALLTLLGLGSTYSLAPVSLPLMEARAYLEGMVSFLKPTVLGSQAQSVICLMKI